MTGARPGGAAEWLGLAATPGFALMALLTALPGENPMAGLCAPGHGSPLEGMAPMYLLMAAFHAAPWLKLIAGRRRPSGPALHRTRTSARATAPSASSTVTR